jgi:5-methylcytosine-specific restriction endonuclease McrA
VKFHILKTAPDGRQAVCKECVSKRKTSPESRQRHREWSKKRRAQPEIKAVENAKSRKWNAEHRAHLAAYKRDFRKRFPEKARIEDRQHIARRRNAPREPYTDKDWADRLAEYDHRCAYCDKHESECGKLTMEHMRPLSRGGPDAMSNIVPACAKCNTRKGIRTLLEFCFGRLESPQTSPAHQLTRSA